jgi:hypothetical protein
VTTAPVVARADTTIGDGSNLKSHTAKALESLEQAIAEHGQRVPDKSSGFPDGTVAVPPDTWRDRYYADCHAREPKVEDDTLSKRYRRAVRELIEGKQVGRTANGTGLCSRKSRCNNSDIRWTCPDIVGFVQIEPKTLDWTSHILRMGVHVRRGLSLELILRPSISSGPLCGQLLRLPPPLCLLRSEKRRTEFTGLALHSGCRAIKCCSGTNRRHSA